MAKIYKHPICMNCTTDDSITDTTLNRAEYYFKLLAVREILTSMPTTSAVKDVLSIIGGELNTASEFLYKHTKGDNQ